MFGFKTEELVIVLVIVLVLFGGKQLPELSRGLSSAIKELRKGFTGNLDNTPEKSTKTSEKSKKTEPS